MEKLRWGFIGAGYIAKLALYPALLNSEFGEIHAVASTNPERAAELSPSGKIYTDYNELLADPKVEAIYISLPNSLHIEWSIKAMRAGKHVLCEKPLAMNAAQAREAIEVSKETGKLFMEASWNRWHPRTIRLKEIVSSGVIGEVVSIKTAFTYDGMEPTNIRADYALGGGSLYDLGPYSTVAPLWLLDFAPVSEIQTQVTWHPQGCDETVRTTYAIGNARAETLTSMNTPAHIIFEVTGTNGKVSTGGNKAFNSHNEASTLEIEIDGVKSVESFAACDPYQLMADSFAKKIKNIDSWIMPLSESLAFAEFFDQIFQTMGRPE